MSRVLYTAMISDRLYCCISAIRAAVLIQQWYRQYVARTEMRRRYTWHIFQSIEYSGEQAQIKVTNLFMEVNFQKTAVTINSIS